MPFKRKAACPSMGASSFFEDHATELATGKPHCWSKLIVRSFSSHYLHFQLSSLTMQVVDPSALLSMAVRSCDEVGPGLLQRDFISCFCQWFCVLCGSRILLATSCQIFLPIHGCPLERMDRALQQIQSLNARARTRKGLV